MYHINFENVKKIDDLFVLLVFGPSIFVIDYLYHSEK